MNKDAPIICAECKCAKIKGQYLYCEATHKICYNSKPDWCPKPLYDCSESKGNLK